MFRKSKYVFYKIRSGNSTVRNFSLKKRRKIYSDPIDGSEISSIEGQEKCPVLLSHHDEVRIYRDNLMKLWCGKVPLYEVFRLGDGEVVDGDAERLDMIHTRKEEKRTLYFERLMLTEKT